MFVVMAAAECAPAAQAGGLGQVVFGLSRELELRGHAVEIILPKYDCMQACDEDRCRILSKSVRGGRSPVVLAARARPVAGRPALVPPPRCPGPPPSVSQRRLDWPGQDTRRSRGRVRLAAIVHRRVLCRVSRNGRARPVVPRGGGSYELSATA